MGLLQWVVVIFSSIYRWAVKSVRRFLDMGEKRTPLWVAHWEDPWTFAESDDFIRVVNSFSWATDNKESYGVSPPTVNLSDVRRRLRKDVFVAALDNTEGGATGLINGKVLSGIGVGWVILGLLDIGRSTYDKVRCYLNEGFKIIVCVGDTLDQRRAGLSETILSQQMNFLASCIPNVDFWINIVIAYEPVWSFQSNQVIDGIEAEKMHCFLRRWLEMNVGPLVADSTRIICGGHFSRDNITGFMFRSHIDGLLVHGASAQEFGELLEFVSFFYFNPTD